MPEFAQRRRRSECAVAVSCSGFRERRIHVKTAMTEGRNEDAMAPADCARQIVRGVRADKTEVYIGKAKLLRVVMRVSPALGRKIMRDS